jgi:phospholipid/cholesterol/gamma-HCH transport system ATP-binding protein
VSLDIEAGKCLVIIGASGSGKSVMLKHIVGLLTPDAGEVWFAGERIDNLPTRKLMEVRQRFGFLFQMGALFDSMNVEDNVAFPLVEHTTKRSEEIVKIAQQKLKMVGLPEVGKKMPSELSGGQKKRVALARAIALGPEVILYDEPTTGLDPIRSDVINELIIKLEHSAFKIADRIVMLHESKLIFDGAPDDVRNTDHDIVKRFVLGEASESELATLK